MLNFATPKILIGIFQSKILAQQNLAQVKLKKALQGWVLMWLNSYASLLSTFRIAQMRQELMSLSILMFGQVKLVSFHFYNSKFQQVRGLPAKFVRTEYRNLSPPLTFLHSDILLKSVGFLSGFFLKVARAGRRTQDLLVFVYFLNSKQRLRPLGYCSPLDFSQVQTQVSSV